MKIEGRKRPGHVYRDCIEIELESSWSGGVALAVEVRLVEQPDLLDPADVQAFTGNASMLVERERWGRFLGELERLLLRRSGEAAVHCAGGEDSTRLVFFATDPPLHRFGLWGRLHSMRVGDDALGGPGEVRLDFPALHFDRAALERILEELRSYSPPGARP